MGGFEGRIWGFLVRSCGILKAAVSRQAMSRSLIKGAREQQCHVGAEPGCASSQLTALIRFFISGIGRKHLESAEQSQAEHLAVEDAELFAVGSSRVGTLCWCLSRLSCFSPDVQVQRSSGLVSVAGGSGEGGAG